MYKGEFIIGELNEENTFDIGQHPFYGYRVEKIKEINKCDNLYVFAIYVANLHDLLQRCFLG